MNGLKVFGYTLAEVLITLGIIGIIAALTIPPLTVNYQKKEAATKLKYTYSMLAQAILLSEKDNGFESEWELDKSESSGIKITEKFVKTYIEPYIKTIKKDKYDSFSARYDYFYRKNGKLEKVHGHTHYSIALNNGIYLHFNADYSVSNAIQVRVDTNGMKKPNVVGKDTFVIYIYPKLKTLASNVNNRNTLLNCCKSNTSNALHDQLVGCSALIQYDGWQINKDYPW